MELKITIQDERGLSDLFKRAPAFAAKEYRNSLERVAVTVVSSAQRKAPVGKGYSHGGNLRQSIGYKPNGLSGFLVYVNSSYGLYVDQGTRPHVIVPKRSKFLAFQKNGEWVFAKRVQHPGTRPTHFFTDAVTEGQSFADAEMQRAMDKVVQFISG